MRALLLAAGRGTRLAPLTDSTPKILAPIDGRPLLAHQLQYLIGGGVSEIAINVHHHAEQVLACLETLHPQVPVTVSHEPELLGTAGALLPLRDFFSEPAIVLYGDVLTDASLLDLMEEHRRSEPLATLALYSSGETAGKGIVRLDERSGRIESFVEKPAGTPEQALINAGLYVVSPGVLDLIPPGPSDFGHDVWPRALAQGHVLRASILSGYVRDIGSPAALAGAQRNMAAGARSW
jgi:mannose-1-phosphate guanylyltransferase